MESHSPMRLSGWLIAAPPPPPPPFPRLLVFFFTEFSCTRPIETKNGWAFFYSLRNLERRLANDKFIDENDWIDFYFFLEMNHGINDVLVQP